MPRPGPGAQPARPALLARYRDLAELRYDYPLVLAEDAQQGAPVRSLTALFDESLARPAAGADESRRRHHLLRLERRIRQLAIHGGRRRLQELWWSAHEMLQAEAATAERAALASDIDDARHALDVDGLVVECDARTAPDVVTHLWRGHEASRSRRFAERIERLVLGLRELLRADFAESPAARAPGELRRSFGPSASQLLDFRALARILGHAERTTPMPQRRRRRIRALLRVLETQRFTPFVAGGRPEHFEFDSCRAALRAWQNRQADMVALVRAIAIAELELRNRYVPTLHDPWFRRLDASMLGPEDAEWFPSYRVVVADDADPAERGAVLDALAAGLPFKILMQFDDILDDAAALPAARGRRRAQFASMALGVHHAFVLQSASSHLYRMAPKMAHGIANAGPALFCVYSGCGPATAPLPPYLAAAAAVESRAFPLMTYDPAAGDDWATRFDVRDNPQPEAAWPRYRFDYEGPDRARMSEGVCFTFADFAACDARCRARLQPGSAESGLPFVDAGDRLYRLAADDDLVRATQRCAQAWRSLQELGGIDNSHARRLLEQERKAWSAKQAVVAPPAPAPASAPAPTASAPPVEAPAEAPAVPAGQPYIETARCTTCDECIQINNRLFAYDANKQAYIADASAGTYRDLVTAAESCQVSIIHPGQPRDPAEPGIEDLIQRATPFQ